MSESVIEVTTSTWDDEVINAKGLVMIDFWAAWCGQCRAIAPIVDEIADEFAGKLKVGKCNVDENPSTPSRFGIRAIPTLIFFKNGSVVEQITGAVAKSQIAAVIDRVIAR